MIGPAEQMGGGEKSGCGSVHESPESLRPVIARAIARAHSVRGTPGIGAIGVLKVDCEMVEVFADRLVELVSPLPKMAMWGGAPEMLLEAPVARFTPEQRRALVQMTARDHGKTIEECELITAKCTLLPLSPACIKLVIAFSGAPATEGSPMSEPTTSERQADAGGGL